MMRLARIASLLVALSLLTSAAPAHAECAWVLWGRLIGGPPKNEEMFFTLDAFESRKICQEARQAQFDDQAKQAAAQGEKVDGMIHHRTGVTESYLCLPDTVDPRGPKGK